MAASARMPLGQGTLIEPASRETGVGRGAMQVARYGGAQRAPGRARQGSGGNSSAGRDASSPTNAALLGAASAYPPLFVRFECVHETRGSIDVDGGSSRRGDGGVAGGGGGGDASAAGRSRPRPETKGHVVDTRHSLSRALKAVPRCEANPSAWTEEPAEEDGANLVAGTSGSGPQTYLCMFATTYPVAGWPWDNVNGGGGGGGTSGGGIRRNGRGGLDETVAPGGGGGGRDLAANLQTSLTPGVFSPVQVWVVRL